MRLYICYTIDYTSEGERRIAIWGVEDLFEKIIYIYICSVSSFVCHTRYFSQLLKFKQHTTGHSKN